MEKMTLNRLSAEPSPASSKMNRPVDPRNERDQAKLKKAAADFESIFISYMLKTMRSTIPQSDLNKGPGSDFYKMMFDRQVAQSLSSKNGGIGLQQMLLQQFDRQTKPTTEG